MSLYIHLYLHIFFLWIYFQCIATKSKNVLTLKCHHMNDKEDVVCVYTLTHTHTHRHNGILLSHKEERNWVICRDVDGPRDGHTEWSKSKKLVSYINAYMWNLEKWYRWTGLQGRNRDADVEKQGWWWWWDELGDWDWHVYTNMYKTDN